MASLPADVLLGLYLGVLAGIVPALLVWAASFGFTYREGLSLPQTYASALGVALAGIFGLLLATLGHGVAASAGPVRLLVATVIVAGLAAYAHSKGDRMAAEFPRRLSLGGFGQETVTHDRADLVEDGTAVHVQVVGEVSDMDGYPALSEQLRARLRNAEMELPADLRLGELETRFEQRLETVYDLASVEADIDETGRARLAAAPPFSGLSKRVGGGRHAVSVSGLVPTGIARGDEVTVITPDAQVRGTVVSASTDADEVEGARPAIEPNSTDSAATEDEEYGPVRTPTTDGGEGQVTVAVTRTDVAPLLRAPEAKIVVESRDIDREYEVVSMLRRAGHHIQRVPVRAGSRLDGATLGTTDLREREDVAVLAVRKEAGWQIAPAGETTLWAGDELFAAGTRDNLDSFASTVT
jgi:hypothetical protein